MTVKLPKPSPKELKLVWGQTANLSSFRGYRPVSSPL